MRNSCRNANTRLNSVLMFSRFRLLGYHGADLSEADQIEAIRNTVDGSSPLAKRFFDESDNENEHFFETMINRKKPAGWDLDYPKNPADKADQYGGLDVKGIVEKLHPNHEKIDRGTKSETESLASVELTDDLRVSDLSGGYVNQQFEKEWGESVGYDETDNMPDFEPLKKLGKVLNTDDATQSAAVDHISGDVGLDTSAVDEGSEILEYMPKSHITVAHQRWSRFLCCGPSEERGRTRSSHNRSRFTSVRGYFRTISTRVSNWFHALAY